MQIGHRNIKLIRPKMKESFLKHAKGAKEKLDGVRKKPFKEIPCV